MRALLDTHLLLWAAFDPARLSPVAKELIESSVESTFFSLVTLWEVAIKNGLGKPGFSADPRALRKSLLNNGFLELLINSEHAFTAGGLPPIHKDPFDRMLVAQATVEGITLLTADATIARYPGPIQKV